MVKKNFFNEDEKLVLINKMSILGFNYDKIGSTITELIFLHKVTNNYILLDKEQLEELNYKDSLENAIITLLLNNIELLQDDDDD